MRPSRRRLASTEWSILSVVLVGLVLLLVHVGWLWRWDQLLYDTQLNLWSRPAPDDIVIVAIDGDSLSQLGRWPWPRGIHAQLIRRLTAAGARGIILDILFAEQDKRDSQGDKQLVDAVTANGRVVLPVAIEQLRLEGQLIETLPMTSLAIGAAALGHVHIDLDPDGMARRVHLLEGVGTPRWPSLSVALLRLLEPGDWNFLPGLRRPSSQAHSQHVIVRDHQVLVPFAGPPGHFPQISYAQVLSGKLAGDALRDKIVLVGVTATGLGDSLPTPVSGLKQPMSGVEINANLLDALRRGITIEVLEPHWHMLLSGVLLMLPFILFPRLTPRFVLFTSGLMILTTLALSILLLHGFGLWFPPTAVLLGLMLGYPLWSWRRLEHTMRYFEQELDRLHAERKAVPFNGESLQLSEGLTFLQSIIPFDGWILRDTRGQLIGSGGRVSSGRKEQGVVQQGHDIWTSIPREQGAWQLGLFRDTNKTVSANTRRMLEEFIQQFATPLRPAPRSAAEYIENQIEQIQGGIAELRAIRGFISDTLRQMVDGLLVINSGGQVVLANNQAARFLGAHSEAELTDTDMMALTGKLEIQGATGWIEVIREVLVEQNTVRLEGRIPTGKELLIQLSPLSITGSKLHGMIVILSDITLLKQSERKRAEALHFLSHDLRSPITSLLSLVQVKRQDASRFDSDEMSERVEGYAKKALKLAEDFLQLAKAENVDQTCFHETDFVTIVHNAMDEVFAEARAKNIKLIRLIGVEEVWFEADAGLMERALTNLLGNAIRYSPESSKIEVRVSADDTEIQCCIRDQGFGIPAKELARIFEPFHRIERSGPQRERGTGLGLAFVKVVAEKHKGLVEVESSPGQGSLFCLKLPRPLDRDRCARISSSGSSSS